MSNKRADIQHYGVLKLKQNCNDLEINKAIKDLATYCNIRRQKNGDIQRFPYLIVELYDVLSNLFKRIIFNRYGEVGLKMEVSEPTEYISPDADHGNSLSTFREFFGTPNPYGDLLSILEDSGIMKPINEHNFFHSNVQSLITLLPLTLTEIFFGAVKKIEVAKLVFLNKEKINNIFGNNTLNIIVKPGLPKMTQIIFSEKRDYGLNGIRTEIVFVTKDLPHEKFIRQEDNLIMTMNISLNEALNGTVVVVDTLDNRILRVSIAPIITADYQKCVVGEGLPVLAKPNQRGDLIIKFNIKFPMDSPMATKYHHAKKLCLGGEKKHKPKY